MKRFLIFLVTCAVAFGLQSCKNEADYYQNRIPIFRVLGPDGSQTADISIDGKAQSVSFKVYATEAWTAKVDNDAYSFSKSMGSSGITEVQLISTSNETGAARSAVITYSLGNGTEQIFNLTQEEQHPYLDVDKYDVSVDGDGEDITISVETNQSAWAYNVGEASSWLKEKTKTSTSVTFSVPENTSGATRSAEMLFYAVESPTLAVYVNVTQKIPTVPPTAKLLDVVFNSDLTAKDVSGMNMEVKSDRVNNFVATTYLDRYKCYAAKFSNPEIGSSDLSNGYYYIPYTVDSNFAKKLAAGFSYELVFCSYTDPTAKQVKPFASTQAGGTGMCFRAATGEINYEVHVGGKWYELYSDILPKKNQYYHVIATWDKVNGIAKLYVDGESVASANTTGDFDFMTTSSDARWFGIGADPNSVDKGEASFYGEVVIARLYDTPISADEAKALYKLVK